MKKIACHDLGGPDCHFTATAETESELVEMVKQHALRVHGLEMGPELRAKVKSVMREEK